ncbi:MAG: hypothetical protein Q4D21_03605 [Phascolarctobacterium sp.]|nr:hypothetical protein [Phascolarctobacterium sp.]
MRSLLILIDGLGDEPIGAWWGRTPFTFAKHPTMDKLVSLGTKAMLSICEDDLVPESCSCISRLLGVAKEDMPHNRAYMELLAHNRDISEYEMVLRCNLVAVDEEGHLAGFNGQGLSPQTMSKAAAICNNLLSDIEFIHLSEYRNLLVMCKEEKVLTAQVPPPHENVGGIVDELLANLRNQSLSISYFLSEAKKRLAAFSHDGLHYELYPWGASAREVLPSFEALHNLKGGAVCKAEIVKGLATALEMQLLVPSGATGDVNTNIPSKTAATLELLKHNDFVICHFNGTDEAAHRYDYAGKARFIEQIDSDLLKPIMESYQEPLKIVVCGDHITSSVTGKHGKGKLPVLAGIINAPAKKIKLENYHDILDFLMKEGEA